MANTPVDPESLFTLRKCSREPTAGKDGRRSFCGKVLAVKRGHVIPNRCPSCGADWVRGDAPWAT